MKRRSDLRRYLRTAGIAWCCLTSAGALAGGLFALFTRESDDA